MPSNSPKPFGRRHPSRPTNNPTYESTNERLERQARARCGLPGKESLRDLWPTRLPAFFRSKFQHPKGRKELALACALSAVLTYWLEGPIVRGAEEKVKEAEEKTKKKELEGRLQAG